MTIVPILYLELCPTSEEMNTFAELDPFLTSVQIAEWHPKCCIRKQQVFGLALSIPGIYGLYNKRICIVCWTILSHGKWRTLKILRHRHFVNHKSHTVWSGIEPRSSVVRGWSGWSLSAWVTAWHVLMRFPKFYRKRRVYCASSFICQWQNSSWVII
jgi:hypothetical protein